MTRERIETAVQAALRKVLVDDALAYDGAATAGTLGLDSLDRLELAFELQDHFPKDRHKAVEAALEKLDADTPLAAVVAKLTEALDVAPPPHPRPRTARA